MLSDDVLAAALVGYQAELSKIDSKMAELRAQLRGSAVAPNGASHAGSKHGGMSAAGKRRIAEAQRKRWAALKAAKAEPAMPKKRKLSAAGRAAIVKAVKARWATSQAKAGKKTTAKARQNVVRARAA
jgi:hypothetical protein